MARKAVIYAVWLSGMNGDQIALHGEGTLAVFHDLAKAKDFCVGLRHHISGGSTIVLREATIELGAIISTT